MEKSEHKRRRAHTLEPVTELAASGRLEVVFAVVDLETQALFTLSRRGDYFTGSDTEISDEIT